jgi:archaellum component FlaC
LQKVLRGRITRNKISNEIGPLETQIAGIEKQVNKATEKIKTNAATKLQKVIRGRITRNKISNEIGPLETQLAGIENKVYKEAEKVENKKIEEEIKQKKHREEASNRIKAATKTKLIKQFKEAKKELRPQNVGQPLVVKQNTKELILKKNRDRGIKAQQAAASKKRSSEQEKIINFSKFMMEQNKIKTN